jgi:hypothetical protein
MKQSDKAMKVLSSVTPEVTPKAGKRIEVDGKFYRLRRGKLVEIPEKWVGKVTHPQTSRKRQSHIPSGKKAKELKDDWWNDKRGTETTKRQKNPMDDLE